MNNNKAYCLKVCCAIAAALVFLGVGGFIPTHQPVWVGLVCIGVSWGAGVSIFLARKAWTSPAMYVVANVFVVIGLLGLISYGASALLATIFAGLGIGCLFIAITAMLL